MTTTKQGTQTSAAAFELHDQDLENVVGGRFIKLSAAGQNSIDSYLEMLGITDAASSGAGTAANTGLV